jgi:hypothetical protein
VRPADTAHGPWDHSIEIAGPTPWFESCNLTVERAAFVAVDGFPLVTLLPNRPAARGFGEDVLLGWALRDRSKEQWVSRAVVRHRWLPGSFRSHLSGQWRVAGFPLLLRELPQLRATMWCRLFLSKRTAAFDLALVAAVLTPFTTAWLAVAVLPWVVVAWPDSRQRSRFRAPLRLLQLAVADAVTLLALLDGSIRARRVLL